MTDHTRRSWMVTIGQAAVGASLTGQMGATASDGAKLPPGVYEPSRDHLAHALMSAEAYHPVPPGCPTEYVRPRVGPFKAEAFTAAEFEVVRRLVQLILGEAESEAGVTQEVAEWIDLRTARSGGVRTAWLRMDASYRRLSEAYHGPDAMNALAIEDPARVCREGLAWLAEAKFMALDTAQQTEILNAVSAKDGATAETKFFKFIKGETIRGFYTSAVGLKELDFKGNAYYARSPGCVSK